MVPGVAHRREGGDRRLQPCAKVTSWHWRASRNELIDRVAPPALLTPHLLRGPRAERRPIGQEVKGPWSAATEVDAVLCLVNLAHVPRRRDGAIGRPPREWIREADDPTQALSAKLVKRASDEPGLTVEGHLIEEHEATEFDGLTRLAGEHGREHRVVARVTEDGDALQRATPEETEAVARRRVGAGVVMLLDEGLRGRVSGQRRDLVARGVDDFPCRAEAGASLPPPLAQLQLELHESLLGPAKAAPRERARCRPLGPSHRAAAGREQLAPTHTSRAV